MNAFAPLLLSLLGIALTLGGAFIWDGIWATFALLGVMVGLGGIMLFRV
jgi:hypothetical protein